MEETSVVIRCGNDRGVLRAIESIDTQCEVLVAFSGSADLGDAIRATGAHALEVPEGNLSVVSNRGFHATHGSKVIFTDSDTEFGPRCVERLSRALDEFPVARAQLRFSESGGRASKVVARTRAYVNRLPLVYTPGIAVIRTLPQAVGGLLFNDPIPYAVDADLDMRIKRAGLRVAFLEDAWLTHGAIPLRHDVRAAYRIGRGCRRSMDHWNRAGTYGHLDGWSLKAVKPTALPDILRREGAAALAYQTLWDVTYWLGFYREGTRSET